MSGADALQPPPVVPPEVDPPVAPVPPVVADDEGSQTPSRGLELNGTTHFIPEPQGALPSGSHRVKQFARSP
jgi:hypothetical protein